MKSYLAIALIVLTASFGAGTASAQVRLPNNPPAAPSLKVKPNIPKTKLIPPSIAIKNVMAANPGAKPLNLQRAGGNYIVKLKKGNSVIQMNVNAATGAMTRIP